MTPSTSATIPVPSKGLNVLPRKEPEALRKLEKAKALEKLERVKEAKEPGKLEVQEKLEELEEAKAVEEPGKLEALEKAEELTGARDPASQELRALAKLKALATLRVAERWKDLARSKVQELVATSLARRLASWHMLTAESEYLTDAI